MKAYISARMEAEALIRASGIPATILRPWYVLGPGHRWPILLMPFYWLFQRLEATKETANRLGLVTLAQMLNALATAVEHPSNAITILEVPSIRRTSIAKLPVQSGTRSRPGAALP